MSVILKSLLLSILLSIPCSCFAENYLAISSYIGARISEDLLDDETQETTQVSNSTSQALLISWKHGRNKEGEILFSNSRQKLTSSADESSPTILYSNYIHWGGRIFIVKNTRFSTSLASGIGASLLIPQNGEYHSEMAWSGNITGGLRYQLGHHWAIRGDLRIYGTLLNSDSSIFCSSGRCLISIHGKLFTQTELMAGIEYRF